MKITITDRTGAFVAYLEWKDGDVKASFGKFDRSKDVDEWAMLQNIKSAVENARETGYWRAEFDTGDSDLFVHPLLIVPKLSNPLGFWMQCRSIIELCQAKVKFSEPLPEAPTAEELAVQFEPDHF